MDTLDKYLTDTSPTSESGKMPQKSTPKHFQISTSCVQDSHVKPSVLQVSEKVSKKQEELSFSKLQESLKKKDQSIYFLKTSKDYSTMTKEERLKSSSKRWMSLGMMSNGKCLTLNFSFHKTGRESSLLDILEDNVPEKYYLSEKYVEYLKRNLPKHTYQVLLQQTTKDRVSKESQTRLLKVGNIDKKGHNSLWGRVYNPDGISSTLNAHGGGLGAKTGLYLTSHTKANIKQRYQQRDETWTLDTSGNKMAVEDKDLRIRKLTPTECERLQGFPDGWTKGQSDTQRYKQLGNAVTVDVVDYIIGKWDDE